MATLDEVLSQRPPAEQERVEEKLYLLSSDRTSRYQAYGSLKAESRLPKEVWNELIDVLLGVGSDPVEIQRAIRDVCRRRTLSGDRIQVPARRQFGRAVTVSAFVAMVKKTLPRSMGRARNRAWKEVRDLYTKPFAMVRSRWQTRPLGQHLMWSTFNEKARAPFRGLPKSADGIRRVLGLDPRFKGQPLLLLKYTLGDGAPPLFPTIADAYAGDEWSYFFNPAPQKAPHGMTMAWPDYARQTKPRPEVVHKVVHGARLEQKPERIRP